MTLGGALPELFGSLSWIVPALGCGASLEKHCFSWLLAITCELVLEFYSLYGTSSDYSVRS